MPTQIALLRGINVGGHNRIAMSDLKELLAELGFPGAKSLLQTGNLIFECDNRTGADLQRNLEVEIEGRLGLLVDCVIRTADQWRSVVSRNPFPKEAQRDPGHLLIMFFKLAPQAQLLKALQLNIPGPERICADGRQLYLVYPDGIRRSKLTNSLIERKLGLRGTARNWNTVLRLRALLD